MVEAKSLEVVNKPQQRSVQFLRKIGLIFKIYATAMAKDIPLELALYLSPKKRDEVMKDFEVQLATTSDAKIIRVQVKIMLGILEKHFPDLEQGMTHWMNIRHYFFNRIGLWGKSG